MSSIEAAVTHEKIPILEQEGEKESSLPEECSLTDTHRQVDEEAYKQELSTGAYEGPDRADEAYPLDEKEAKNHIENAEMEKRESRDKYRNGDGKDTSMDDGTTFRCKITVALRETTTAKGPQQTMDNMSKGPDGTERKTWKFIKRKKAMAQLPTFSKSWKHWFRFSSEGATVKRQGSGVVLTVPPAAIEVSTDITVYSAICTNDAYVKQKLDLSAIETVVSPLAEFWAGPDVRFKKHVEVTLPTCLAPDCDVSRVHVYCITSEAADGQMNVSKLERWDVIPQSTDKTTPEAFFYIINEKRQVRVRTTHFSGYVCTSCGQCQNIQLDVYAYHKHKKETVYVTINAFLGDKLRIPDYNEAPEASRRVLSDSVQLKNIFQPAELAVKLALEEEEADAWEFTETTELEETFLLNWERGSCQHCPKEVIKYTELGLFSHSWKLKSKKCKQDDLPSIPSILEALIVISHSQKRDDQIRSSAQTKKRFVINVKPDIEDTNGVTQENGDEMDID